MRLTEIFRLDTAEAESPDAASDRALVARIVQRDQAAMAALMARYQTRVFRFVLRYVGSRELAEDVVREVFFAAWQSAPRFESRSTVSTWLLAIARYRALSARQQSGAPADPMTDELAATIADPTDLPDAAIERRQSIEQLRECLAMLPPADGALFDLVYYHEKSLREVAEILGVPVNTVKTRMVRARRRLAALMTAREAGDPVETRDSSWTASPRLQPLGRDGTGQETTHARNLERFDRFSESRPLGATVVRSDRMAARTNGRAGSSGLSRR
jgi:RNA polymerase sigma-70 factor, ECF subfamily